MLYNGCNPSRHKGYLMDLEVVKPEVFFLEKSSFKKHPNLNNIRNKQIDSTLLENDGVTSRKSGNVFQFTKTGFRKDIEMNVRSSWEANFVRVLNIYKIQFEFEPTVFSFPIKRGTKGYTPDFFLTRNNEWIEVKGYLDDKSKIKLKRFKRYYPEEFEKFTCVISRYNNDGKRFMADIEVPQVIFYEDIRDYYSEYILNWEGKR
jgi:hypothetical protein